MRRGMCFDRRGPTLDSGPSQAAKKLAADVLPYLGWLLLGAGASAACHRLFDRSGELEALKKEVR